VIKVVICLFGEKVKENSNKYLSHLAVGLENRFRQTHFPDAGRGKERGESHFFFIKIMGWEAIVLPNQKMQI
jgi:hypothetical protein